MNKFLVALFAIACLAASTQAISIKWTGYANNNQWFTPTNWYPDQVPTTEDDVTIEFGVVQVPQAAGCNSLSMGTNFNKQANLTIFNTFIVGSGGMTVDGNGFVFVNAGTASISGALNVAGALYFQSGSLSGQVTVSNRGVADLSGLAQKVLTGCSFSSAGTLTLGGNLVLNQSSQFTVTSTATVSGNFAVQNGDGSAVLFDTSAGTLTYTGNGVFSMQAPVSLGVFNFATVSPANLTIYSDVTFVNTFAIPQGSFVSTLGVAKVNMSAGLTGAGVLSGASAQLTLGNVNFTGAINSVGGNVTFSTGKNTVNLLTLDGGDLNVNANTAASMFNALNGALNGALVANKGYIKSQGFDLNGELSFNGAVTTAGMSLIAFGTNSALKFNGGSSFVVQGSLQLTGAPGRTVTNNGQIVAKDSLSFQNINLAGSGSMTVSSTVTVSTCSIAQSAIALNSDATFKGANTLLSVGAITGSDVKAVIGSYSFKCGKQCSDVNTDAQPTATFSFSS